MKRNLILGVVSFIVLLQLTACGGGGSRQKPVLFYPYETVFGEVCNETTPVPGCTFRTLDGRRVTVSEDRDFNRSGNGSNDLQFVIFREAWNGRTFETVGDVFTLDSRGRTSRNPIATLPAASFQGHQFSSTIGVGVTGLFWRDVLNGNQFWFGPSSGVLYDANDFSSTFGQAINNSGSERTNNRWANLEYKAEQSFLQKAAYKLQQKLPFMSERQALNMATQLDQIAVAHVSPARVLTLSEQDNLLKDFVGVDARTATRVALDVATTGDVNKAAPLFNEAHRTFGFEQEWMTAKTLRVLFGTAQGDITVDLDEVVAKAGF